jgi:hypothetical protein
MLGIFPSNFGINKGSTDPDICHAAGGVLAKRSCIFCDTSGPLTNEHVIPDWLQGYVGGSEKSTVRAAHLGAIGTLLSERRASGNSHKLGTVCEACNNGWMSDLESSFSSLLPRLEADMSPRQFSTAERRARSGRRCRSPLMATPWHGGRAGVRVNSRNLSCRVRYGSAVRSCRCDPLHLARQ